MCYVPGNKEDEFLNNYFKRFAAVISLSLIATIAIIPCAAFFVSAQTVNDTAVISKTEPTEAIVLNESSYKANEILSDKESVSAVLRAQAFDMAKKVSKETLAAVEETKAQAAAKDVKDKVEEAGKYVSSSAPTSSKGNGKYLLTISNPDPNYIGRSVSLTAYDRDVLEHLVMGEAGGEGYIGACLVAQTIRDTLLEDGYSSVEAVRIGCSYYGSLYNTPNEDVLNAVKFIFDEGGSAVQHSLHYFYAPAVCTSGFHESQEFVVEHNNHRFFDRW